MKDTKIVETINGFKSKISARVVEPILSSQQFSIEFDEPVCPADKKIKIAVSNLALIARLKEKVLVPFPATKNRFFAPK
jgi:hypothetical protein